MDNDDMRRNKPTNHKVRLASLQAQISTLSMHLLASIFDALHQKDQKEVVFSMAHWFIMQQGPC